MLAPYREWLDEHSHVIEQLRSMQEALAGYLGEGGALDKVFDMKETVFLFFFDC